jgi:hypothetical protein
MTGHPNGVKTAAMSYYGSTQTLRTLARKGYLRIVWDDPTEPIFMRENV